MYSRLGVVSCSAASHVVLVICYSSSEFREKTYFFLFFIFFTLEVRVCVKGRDERGFRDPCTSKYHLTPLPSPLA